MHSYDKNWLWLIGFALVYCVGVNERENQISGMEMFQSNIHYCVRIKGYILHAQDSCACTRFLCMHNTVHAQEPGLGPKKGAGPVPGPGPALFLGPRPGPCACTRVLCMHKSVVHAQESCACTRILTNKTYQDVPDVTRHTNTPPTPLPHPPQAK